MFVAFDVGETLVHYEGVALDWSAHYRFALGHALAVSDAEIDPQALAAALEILQFYNTRRNPRTFEIEAGEVTRKLAALFAVPHAAFERGFFGYFSRRSAIAPGAHDLLVSLKQAGAYIVALSDVPYGMPATMLVEDLRELSPLFDRVASSCDLGVRKPSGEGLRRLWREAGAPARACYVGNEEKDMQAARAAGMAGVLVSSSREAPDYGQHQTVTDMQALRALLL
ncbi:MAG: HAD family hydrolase [Moraxellaceae bacterium]|nr:HAD family hydrolase [Moraxellaceae bacterium]